MTGNDWPCAPTMKEREAPPSVAIAFSTARSRSHVGGGGIELEAASTTAEWSASLPSMRLLAVRSTCRRESRAGGAGPGLSHSGQTCDWRVSR